MRKAVILLSGGIDSATTAAISSDSGYELYCLSFDYGQRHKFELNCASKVADFLHAKEHKNFRLDMRRIGGSALTADIDVPKNREIDTNKFNIPITYVPARNMIFLSIASAWAEVIGANDIFIGVTAVDFSGYPDCRPEFIKSFEQTLNLGTKQGVEGNERMKVHTPLINLSKKEIVELGTKLGLDYSLTISCYDPDEQGRSCGECDSCQIRHQAFIAANIADPTIYVK
ncbi:MAG: 7-cyano-7-deazaguanine synthase QueC [Planctomycetes bacterium]|nr:7-cyano-7-deazaguanine synthase QueC [Planctomycetota bacterium]